MVFLGCTSSSFFNVFCFAYGVDKTLIMPPEDNGYISLRVSEHNPISGDSTEIESVTTSVSEEPRIVWNIEDLSGYTQTIEQAGLTPIVEFSKIEWTVDSEGSRSAFLRIEKEYPGLMKLINNIVESRIVESRGIPLIIEARRGLITAIEFECMSVLSHRLNIPRRDIYINPIGHQVMVWLSALTKDIANGKVRERYFIGPDMSSESEVVQPKNKRGLVIFKGK